MAESNFLIHVSSFHGRTVPVQGKIVGYGAIIESLNLPVPLPNMLAIVQEKTKKYSVEGWQIFPPSYQPEERLYKQLVFALKYEGVNLLAFKELFGFLEGRLMLRDFVGLRIEHEAVGDPAIVAAEDKDF
jgi:hypothetical protein